MSLWTNNHISKVLNILGHSDVNGMRDESMPPAAESDAKMTVSYME